MRSLCLVLLLAHSGFTVEPEAAEFFEKKIRPVLVERCYDCHGPKAERPMGGLRLSSKDSLAKGGDSGPALVPRDPESSRLIRAIRYLDPKLQMPPKARLTETQIRDFETWVRMGAPDPRTDETAAAKPKGIDFARARRHWAFQPLKESPPPPVRADRWARGPIDRFLLAKLEEKGLKPAGPADRRTLLRRVYLDVIGLPPSPGEVDAFLADRSPRAFATVVDRLLESPHYGERWARHWLDLMRYAETDGHEFDQDKPNAWRYRDYVIRAFNQDLPYDRFVREQLAGDLLPDRRVTPDGLIDETTVATGFYWLGEIINTPVDTYQALADRIDNQIDVIGKTFLGLTVACSRCHDHKFDPISSRDYYSLAGFLHSSRLRQASADAPAVVERVKRLLPRGENGGAATKPALDSRYELFEDFSKPGFARWLRTGLAFGDDPTGGTAHSGRYSLKLTGALVSRQFLIKQRYIHVRLAGGGMVRLFADEYTNGGRVVRGDDRMQWKTIDARMGQGNLAHFEIGDYDASSYVAVDRICFSDSREPPPNEGPHAPAIGREAELDAQIPSAYFALATADGEPKDVPLHIRGNPHTPGDPQPRRFLEFFSQEPPVTEGSGRLELSRRMFTSASPLVARVMVNRMWKHHFGEGLVRTPDNFGMTGDRPSHPELLDYLARRFIEQGWSIRKLHREMLLSSAYQMSSRPDDRKAEVADPRNELLHRMPVRRLEAEILRDQILAVAGTLGPAMFGPPVPVYVSPYMDSDPRGKPKSGPVDGNGRRSIYINVRRNFLPDMMLTFDYPQPISTIGRRSVSTVASQALYLMNSSFTHLEARKWAERLVRVEPAGPARVRRMYREAFARPPGAEELAQALAFMRQVERESGGRANPLVEFAHVLLNATEFAYVH
ncbi:MAG: PSD1 and planctomycete cytochrome C domain-containing protein [Bryobacteraceae bacterium]